MMGILSVLTICFITVGAAAAQPPTQAQQDRLDAVFVNGTELKAYLEGHPSMGYVYIDDNTRTMVPLRAIGDLLGLQTQFRSADQAIVIDGGAKGQVVFHLNSTAYSVGGARCTMDTAPVCINGRTHVPIRFLVESLGGLVYYTPKSGYHNGVAEIYCHANDVTPTAPSWAGGDYVTFTRTSAYTPEHWAVLSQLRERAARGEDVSKDVAAFSKQFLCPGSGMRTYAPACTQVLGMSLPDFFAEPWFSQMDSCPAPIYFDNDCPTGSPSSTGSDRYPTRWWLESVYTDGGVTRVDLELVGAGLSLKRDSEDYHVTSPGIRWAKEERDGSGDLRAVEMDWDGTTIRVSRDASSVQVGGRTVSLGAKAVLHTDPISGKAHLYVPMSFLTDVLGETVTYDKDSGLWFVGRTHQVSDPNLEKWALAMCAVMSRRGDGNPYYLGMYNRCMRMQTQFIPSPANPEYRMRYYSFYPAYHIAASQLEQSWGCTDADDIRTQAQLLTASPDARYPAWDLFRVAHIASWGYAAGYLSADEALNLIKPAAQKLQQAYTCWDDAYADWIDGYRVVFGGDAAEQDLRRQIYTSLKEAQATRGILFDDGLFAAPLK